MRLLYLSCYLMLRWWLHFNAEVGNSWKVVEGKKKWVSNKQIQFEEDHAVSTDSRPCLVAMEKGSVVHNSYEY